MPRGWRKAPHGPTPTLSGIEGLVRGGTLTERALSAPPALPLHVRVRLGGGRGGPGLRVWQIRGTCGDQRRSKLGRRAFDRYDRKATARLIEQV